MLVGGDKGKDGKKGKKGGGEGPVGTAYSTRLRDDLLEACRVQKRVSGRRERVVVTWKCFWVCWGVFEPEIWASSE